MTQIDLTKNDRSPVAVSERSMGQLVADATKDISDLVQHEIALAKAELKKEAVHAGVGAGMFGGAAVFGLVGFILLCFTAVWGLIAAGLSNWLAFGIVTLVLFVIAGVLALIGKSRISKVGPPERTIETARATIAAVKGDR